MTDEIASVLLVDGLCGLNAIVALIREHRSRLYIVESPRGEKLPLTDYNFLEEVIDDGDLYIKAVNGEFWRVEFNDGDIIAVNQEAEWCEICERYEIPPGENVTVYQVEEYYLPAIINGDYSGLSDTEGGVLDNWIEAETQGMGSYHWECVPEHGSEFTDCDVTGLKSKCVELNLINMGG